MPASSRITPFYIVFSVPARKYRLSYVPPGRSGNSSPVQLYSGSSPKSQVSGRFKISNYCM
ncbi:hypothetical protein T10_10119 [Trichinella papuae]|uniref:Uncharacterized protein n=1 Tax=Trichinella papuae TaxID=268474 RepID=A0A0V1LZD1_9BILA|nr:hypothetical protein T10_13270 [Trichinella papuae]KRZ64851.1 hypothetical protein T10_1380 [Trichinella papuae]KRZ64855.1 hypothetical protein T10_10119 [Trichinella papuae]